MVKNAGGSKTKGFARKNIGGSGRNNKLRLAIEEGEHYAVVLKMTGNGMCSVQCIDNVKRLCVIRGKFKGKGMHNNLITIGTWVLVGIREWESTDKKDAIPKCDLLEVYTNIDKDRLKTSVSIDWSILLTNDATNTSKDTNTDDVLFMDEKEEDYRNTIAKSIAINNPINMSTETIDEEEINIDDI
jgi:initiation factor 1A